MDGEIGHEELSSLLDADDEGVRIVDVRPPAAYARGHVPGSENVPLRRLVDDIERFGGDERVVTLCPHGESSVQAARLVASYEGFDGRAESFAPGLAEWDGPVESGHDGNADAGEAGTSHTGGTGGSDAGEASGEDTTDEGPAPPF